MPEMLQHLNQQPVWLIGLMLLTPLTSVILNLARGHAFLAVWIHTQSSITPNTEGEA